MKKKQCIFFILLDSTKNYLGQLKNYFVEVYSLAFQNDQKFVLITS